MIRITLFHFLQADRDDLNETVNRVEFDLELEKFSDYIKELTNELTNDELRSKSRAVDESILETMCKKDDVSNFTRLIEQRILCKLALFSTKIS